MCDYCKENYMNKNMSTDKNCEVTIIDNDIEIDYEENLDTLRCITKAHFMQITVQYAVEN